jgi:hypothetical protein
MIDREPSVAYSWEVWLGNDQPQANSSFSPRFITVVGMTRLRVQAVLCAILVVVLSGFPVRAEVQSDFDHVVIDGVRIVYATPVEAVGKCVGGGLFRSEQRGRHPGGDQHPRSRQPGRHPAPPAPGACHGEGSSAEEGHRLVGIDDRREVVQDQGLQEAVGPAPPSLADFRDRQAQFEGRACQGGRLDAGGTTAKVDCVAGRANTREPDVQRDAKGDLKAAHIAAIS